MRLMLLIFLGANIWSADYQKLTFSDGKTKTGYFDEQKATLTLDDGSTIAIKVNDIIRREPMSPTKKPLDIPPPVKEPDAESPSPKKKISRKRRYVVADKIRLCDIPSGSHCRKETQRR